MRKRDWADAVADEFYELISELADSAPESIVGRVAVELRKAFLMGLEQERRGIILDEAGNGDRSRYIATKLHKGSVGEVAAAKQIITSCRGCKLTWDGQKSRKRDPSNG